MNQMFFLQIRLDALMFHTNPKSLRLRELTNKIIY